MAIFKKTINMPAMFRALADLSEIVSTSEESIQLENTIDLIGGGLENNEQIPCLSTRCTFHADLNALRLELGLLYKKYGGNIGDLLNYAEIEHIMARIDGSSEARAGREIDKTINDDVLDRNEWDASPAKIEHSIDPFTKTSTYYAKVEIQRKDRKVFDSPVGKYIELSGKPFKITEAKMNHFLDTDGHVSASAFILCEFEENSYQSMLMS